jgi:hypothetical protein
MLAMGYIRCHAVLGVQSYDLSLLDSTDSMFVGSFLRMSPLLPLASAILIQNLIWKPYFDPDTFRVLLITNEWQVLFLV